MFSLEIMYSPKSKSIMSRSHIQVAVTSMSQIRAKLLCFPTLFAPNFTSYWICYAL